MFNLSGSKIPYLCSDMLTFFKIAYLGHRDTNPVPLACQEKGINDIQFFGLLSDAKCNFLFQDYDTNGDVTGTQSSIPLIVQSRIPSAIAYCRFRFVDRSNPDALKPQRWDQDEYKVFYMQYCLGFRINGSTIMNDMGNIGKANLLELKVQNFHRAPKNMNNVFPLWKDEHWPQFQHSFEL